MLCVCVWRSHYLAVSQHGTFYKTHACPDRFVFTAPFKSHRQGRYRILNTKISTGDKYKSLALSVTVIMTAFVPLQ